MRTRIVVGLLVVAIAASMGVALAGPEPAAAHRNVCPRWRDFRNGEYADLRSAHDAWKKAMRDCRHEKKPTPTRMPHRTPTPTPAPVATPTAAPTPSPTPEPTAPPQGQADVRMTSVAVFGPASASAGVEFQVSIVADVRNAGPAASALADATFTATAPGDCVATPATPVVVEDSNLALGVGVAISRVWRFTCASPGAHAIAIDGAIALDASQGLADPDTSNNAAGGGLTVQVQ